ncbi:metal ABC transporter ATP-binding protein [Vibrio panuliri]|uniref:Iron ABC transporter permease n=1 Tax=Vibrio panuliri TaxID=1381081 RepID=A0ABX3F5R8_9VIBR|nr:ATP-binding cassette domain-containing protein [Vibrio panuliri]KAB1455136.1 ATP-binding cassette domain-containing protein [Vibrio panuliri]OLQ85292.1 iron ABC transporter permease [Vibrio panuliri]
MSNSVSIVANDVGVVYRNGHSAINNVSFSLEQGTICALVGINGGGKSTLFKGIMGLVDLTTGSIQLAGKNVKQALKQNLVAYVPQTEDIDWNFPILTRDVVMQGRYGYMGFLRIPSGKDHLAVDEAMDKMGIAHLATRQIGELSGGQKKRVFLARALAQKSKIILLDEPFTGVDFNTENVIMSLLKELQQQGHLILVSTHNLGTVPDYCNQVLFINRTIIAAGSTETTFNQENLHATFGGALKQVDIAGKTLHKDDDERNMLIISDHDKPAVFYGKSKSDAVIVRDQNTENSHHV